MNIKFCGAARQVTGSSHLLTLDNGFKILLDCGLFQGSYSADIVSNSMFLFEPGEIDCVVLSHAHIDHCGRLPKLVKDGFKGPIHSTHATRSLATIMLLDSAHIQEKDALFFNKKNDDRRDEDGFTFRDPLYTSVDVDSAMKLFVGYGYDQWHKIHDDVRVMFTDAGHILGSAAVTLEIRENGKTTMLGFTADIGRPHRPILRDPQPMPECDYLICESTYGDRIHESQPNEIQSKKSVQQLSCLRFDHGDFNASVFLSSAFRTVLKKSPGGSPASYLHPFFTDTLVKQITSDSFGTLKRQIKQCFFIANIICVAFYND